MEFFLVKNTEIILHMNIIIEIVISTKLIARDEIS
jgi:hypothetical protein